MSAFLTTIMDVVRRYLVLRVHPRGKRRCNGADEQPPYNVNPSISRRHRRNLLHSEPDLIDALLD